MDKNRNYFIAIGVSVLILIALAHQSLRNYKVRAPDAARAEDA